MFSLAHVQDAYKGQRIHPHLSTFFNALTSCEFSSYCVKSDFRDRFRDYWLIHRNYFLRSYWWAAGQAVLCTRESPCYLPNQKPKPGQSQRRTAPWKWNDFGLIFGLFLEGNFWREQKSDSKQQKLFALLRFLRREKTQDWIGRGLEPIYLTPQPGLHFAIFCGCKQPGKCTGCLVTCCYVWKRGSTAW